MGELEAKPEHLLIILPFAEPHAITDRIKKNHPQIRITYEEVSYSRTPWRGDRMIPIEQYHDATILVTMAAMPDSPTDCPNLKLIQFFTAGINHVSNSPVYTDTTIPFATASGIHGPPIAEWVILTALAHSRKYNLLHSYQTQHSWGKYADHAPLFGVRDRVGLRLGVLGYGSIGRQVARVASAMGMDVIAYTAMPRPTPESKHDPGFIVPRTGDPDGSIPSAWFSGLDKPSLHHFLSQDIDHLLISVPLTTETRHLLGAAEFAILAKRRAFLTNISRGEILHQDELIASLERGARSSGTDDNVGGLSGAALDVADPEPLPAEHPLWDTPNVILTPHISALSEAYRERAFEVLEVNLDRLEGKDGGKLVNEVRRRRGY